MPPGEKDEEDGNDLGGKNIRHWKWVPASAGMTAGENT
jgi:hypothetical protein